MAAPVLQTSGIGGTSGATLATVAPLYTTGTVYYVLSTTGSDSAAGTERENPLATLSQAYTNASAGDIIVLLSGHAETLASSQTLGKAGLLILGEGSGTSRPQLTRSGDVVLLNVTAAGVRIDNVYFPASTVASTNARIKMAAANDRVVNCYFQHGANDTGPGIETVTGASQIVISGTTCISTATSLTAQPAQAIKVTNAITDLQIGGDSDTSAVTIDGGTVGWSNPYAMNLAAAVTRLAVTKLDLLNGSDVTVTTGTTGYIYARTVSGGSRIVWPA